MKITKSRLKQIIKEELGTVLELYGRPAQDVEPAPRPIGAYQEDRCTSCVGDINKDIEGDGYEVVMLDVYPIKYKLKPLAKQPSEPLPADVQRHLDNMVDYDPPFDGI